MAKPSSARRRPTVRAHLDGIHWIFGDRPRRGNGAGQIVARDDDLPGCYATDLQHVMRQADREDTGGDALLISPSDEENFDEKYSWVTEVSFEMFDANLTMVVCILMDDCEPELEHTTIRPAMTPMVTRARMQLISAEVDDYSGSRPFVWRARLGFHSRNRMLDELYQTGLDLVALMEAMRSGELSRVTAGDLVRGGHAHVLIGQPEGHWLDAKADHYDLSTPRGQISLAQAVTRFCNAELGGLVVVGMKTKRVPDGEEIRALSPMPLDRAMVRRYQQTIEHRVFPPPDNMTIEAIAMPTGKATAGPDPGGMLMLIDLAPQPEELKPFLVHGAIIGDHVEGSFISIVRRRGESTIPTTAPMIHSTLAAGRALLRRGHLPQEGGAGGEQRNGDHP